MMSETLVPRSIALRHRATNARHPSTSLSFITATQTLATAPGASASGSVSGYLTDEPISVKRASAMALSPTIEKVLIFAPVIIAVLLGLLIWSVKIAEKHQHKERDKIHGPPKGKKPK